MFLELLKWLYTVLWVWPCSSGLCVCAYVFVLAPLCMCVPLFCFACSGTCLDFLRLILSRTGLWSVRDEIDLKESRQA